MLTFFPISFVVNILHMIYVEDLANYVLKTNDDLRALLKNIMLLTKAVVMIGVPYLSDPTSTCIVLGSQRPVDPLRVILVTLHSHSSYCRSSPSRIIFQQPHWPRRGCDSGSFLVAPCCNHCHSHRCSKEQRNEWVHALWMGWIRYLCF